jgi:hypothetical protein
VCPLNGRLQGSQQLGVAPKTPHNGPTRAPSLIESGPTLMISKISVIGLKINFQEISTAVPDSTRIRYGIKGRWNEMLTSDTVSALAQVRIKSSAVFRGLERRHNRQSS